MQEHNYIKFKEVIPDTNFFVYRDKKYPLKFDYFKYASRYFSMHQEELEKRENINIIDAEPEKQHFLTDETINDFINFVQGKKILLDKKNIISLNYLSTKYEVKRLQEITNDYIIKHQSEIVIEIILEHQYESEFDTKSYESIISHHIERYIEDDRLLELKIPILYRILNDHIKKEKANQAIFDFLFKCIDKHGKKASVLFDQITFEKDDIKYIMRLINDYSQIFDFQYISSALVDALKYKETELKQAKTGHDKLIYSKSSEIHSLKNQNENLNKQNEEIKKENIRLYDEIKKKEIEHNIEIEKQKQTTSKMIKKYEKDISDKNSELNKIKELNNQKDELNLKLKNENDKLRVVISQNEIEHSKKLELQKQTLNKQIEELKHPTINCQDGIFKYLFDKYKNNPVNIGLIQINGNSYYGWDKKLPEIIDPTFDYYWLPEERENSYFKIDFKKFSVKIDKYYLRIGNKYGQFLFKSWNLSGTTEDGQDIILDEVNNCNEITSNHPKTTISIQSNQYIISIKLTIMGKNEDNRFMFDVGNIELYGSMKYNII